MKEIKDKLKQIADENMISEIRFIDAEALEPLELFEGRQPKDMMPDAKSLIISSIYIGGFRLPEEDPDEYGRMSRLTLSGFYWNVVDPLKPLKDYLISQGYQAMIYDGLLEENCVPLKPAAVKAGLGWQGKCTLLISPKYGSFQALGGIITDADLAEVYPKEANRCGDCSACVDSCPGNALEPSGLNRSKCLSNLMEEDGMPETVREIPDNYFFECDICQDACPWNRKHLAEPLNTKLLDTFSHQKELMELFRFDALLNMNEAEYRERILPLLTGVELPFELFRRNVGLAYNYKHDKGKG
jgi:epoxyqueuosine reductase